LILVYGDLGERISGPAIRGWEIAKGLASRHLVTAAVHGATESTLDGIRIVPLTRLWVAREALRHDAVVASSVPPYVMALKAFRKLLVVSDQYDPVDLELGTLDEDSKAAADARAAREVRLLQLAESDVLVCAAEAQRRRLEAELRVIGRRPPVMALVPFGLPEPPPPPVHRPLRERFPQIRDGDKVVLWWGSIWRWLDAPTALRTFEPLAETRPDLKLVLTAGRPPRAEHSRLSAAEEARRLALSMGLLDRTVFFLDDWSRTRSGTSI
jgi:hypothetical protein